MGGDRGTPADPHQLGGIDHEAARDALPVGFLAERLHQPLHRALRHANEVRGAPQPLAHGADQPGDADRLGVGDEEGLVGCPLRAEHERDRGDEVRKREQRAAVVQPGEGERHRRPRQRRERGDVALDPGSIDDGRAEHREVRPACRDQLLGFELGAPIGVGRLGPVSLGDRMVGREPGLRPDRGDQHQPVDFRARRLLRELSHRQRVDAGIDVVGQHAGRVRKAGEMHDMGHAVEQLRPIDRAGKVGERDALDAGADRDGGRVACGGPDGVAVARQRADQGFADEAGGAGDEDGRGHARPRPSQ